MQEKPRAGRPPFLTPAQRKQLSQYIKEKAHNPEGGRLTGADIHAYIVNKFGKHYHPDSIYYLLNNMGFSWITSRSKHPKQSVEVQDAFKKIPNRNAWPYCFDAIESLNSVIRKALKKRKIFPNDEAATKMVYLAIKDASKKWTMPIQNWRQSMSRFIIEFEDRVEKHVN